MDIKKKAYILREINDITSIIIDTFVVRPFVFIIVKMNQYLFMLSVYSFTT
jgi:hypothetical protein